MTNGDNTEPSSEIKEIRNYSPRAFEANTNTLLTKCFKQANHIAPLADITG